MPFVVAPIVTPHPPPALTIPSSIPLKSPLKSPLKPPIQLPIQPPLKPPLKPLLRPPLRPRLHPQLQLQPPIQPLPNRPPLPRSALQLVQGVCLQRPSANAAAGIQFAVARSASAAGKIPNRMNKRIPSQPSPRNPFPLLSLGKGASYRLRRHHRHRSSRALPPPMPPQLRLM